MNILLTGGSGFIGNYIYSAFLKNGHKIHTIGMGINDDDYCNLAIETPKLASNYDVIIHTAGKAHVVPKSKADKEEFFNVNFNGTKNLVNGIAALGYLPQSFVFMSSVAVYGLEKGDEMTEETERLAIDPYGLSKKKSEDYLLNWGSKNGVRIGIIRAPLVLGHNSPGNFGAMIKGIKKGLYCNINNGKARRSMVLAEDLANFIPTISKVGGIYHLTDGYHPSFGEISTIIAHRLNIRKILNVSETFAKRLAKVGDLGQLLTKKECPFTSRKLEKMTSSLTFSDSAARCIGWKPRQVLDNPNLWL